MKAQTGLETLFVAGIGIVILLLAFLSYVSKSSEVNFTRNFLDAQKTCYEIKNIVNQISTNGFGSATKFTIPKKIGLADYNLTIDSPNKTITIEWDGNLFSCTALTQNITNGTHGKFFLKEGDRIAKNSDGVVVIQ